MPAFIHFCSPNFLFFWEGKPIDNGKPFPGSPFIQCCHSGAHSLIPVMAGDEPSSPVAKNAFYLLEILRQARDDRSRYTPLFGYFVISKNEHRVTETLCYKNTEYRAFIISILLILRVSVTLCLIPYNRME